MNAPNILQLIETHKNQLRDFGLIRVGLFGSTMRDEATETSDVDLLLEFEPAKKNYRNFYNSTEYLERLFKRRIDAVTPQSLSPYIRPHMEKNIHYVEIG